MRRIKTRNNRMSTSIEIGGRQIGSGNPAYIIAEAGSNHDGDFAVAIALIDAAAEAGADAIKFQAFLAANHYSKHAPGFTYLEAQGSRQTTYDLIKSLEINRDWHEPLIAHANARGIAFLSSPCDVAAVEQLNMLGMPAFKLASFDLPDRDLIRVMARFGKPLILSTGMADYKDIQGALMAAQEVGNQQVILLQCTSLYPAPAKLANLAAINSMHQAFGVPVGYSDHTLGDHVCVAAVAMGACVLEKHFTLDRSRSGPDHSFAIEPHELAVMVERVRDVEAAIGDGIKNGPRVAEREMYQKGRRSIHTRRAIKKGEVLTRDDLCSKRPGFGISPDLIEILTGMSVSKDIPDDHWITWDDLK